MLNNVWKWVEKVLARFDDYQIPRPMPLDGKDRT